MTHSIDAAIADHRKEVKNVALKMAQEEISKLRADLRDFYTNEIEPRDIEIERLKAEIETLIGQIRG